MAFASRSPLGFLLGAYRTGYRGAFVAGLLHGVFCIGCCWLLMLLVWVGGMMNLAWMAVLSLLVIMEKTAPGAERLVGAAGVVLVVLGAAQLLFSESGSFLTFDAIASMCRRPL
jgi:predicted metal-binding membrane protein